MRNKCLLSKPKSVLFCYRSPGGLIDRGGQHTGREDGSPGSKLGGKPQADKKSVSDRLNRTGWRQREGPPSSL